MTDIDKIKSKIFKIKSEAEFQDLALNIFEYQYKNVSVYREFCNFLKTSDVNSISEIPFLPISFFKSHKVADSCTLDDFEILFKSSGTSAAIRSKHFIYDVELYEKSFLKCFKMFFGEPKDYAIFGLLPNYLEQGESSLVYMVDYLIKQSNCKKSGFYLDNYEDLISEVKLLKEQNHKKIIIFGVSYALMDLVDFGPSFSDVIIVETGGMKGRRKELLKEDLHNYLKKGFSVKNIYSEYGMTELLSQAYFFEDSFQTPPWMQVFIRDVNDPKSFLPDDKTGALNIIDLANIHSCSFIATDDLGKKTGSDFQVLGRMDNSDVRGCNLLVN